MKEIKNNKQIENKNATNILQTWFNKNEEFYFIEENKDWLAMPKTLKENLPLIKKNLYLRKAGVRMGQLIRNQLVPNHELALSMALSTKINRVELDEKNAIEYLRKKEFHFSEVQNGWCLVTNKSLPLGWIKALPNRINNYYPSNWRILK